MADLAIHVTAPSGETIRGTTCARRVAGIRMRIGTSLLHIQEIPWRIFSGRIPGRRVHRSCPKLSKSLNEIFTRKNRAVKYSVTLKRDGKLATYSGSVGPYERQITFRFQHRTGNNEVKYEGTQIPNDVMASVQSKEDALKENLSW